MADITKDSFLESNRHTKLVYQRGRDVLDCDLNEMQDILRSFMYRQYWSGVQGITLNPAAVDDSWKIVENTGDTSNKVKAEGRGVGISGYLFCDGVGLFLNIDEEITGTSPDHMFVSNDTDVPRHDGLYLRVTEEEVADPAPFPILGETAKRRKLQYSWYVDTRDATPPTSSNPYTDPIWSGGIRFFKMATILRPAHTSEILTAYIVDNRFLLIQEAFSQIVREANHEIQALVAHTIETTQPYQFFDVDLPNNRLADKGCGFVWSAGRDDPSEHGYTLAELSHFNSGLMGGLFTLNTGYAFGCKDGTQFWDNLINPFTLPIRLTEPDTAVNQLRMLDRYVEAHRGSILRTINARVGISIGDGTNTFGDFNGTDALYRAFMYYIEHIYTYTGITSCVIFVKGGTHIVESSLYTTENIQLYIVGQGANSKLYLDNTDEVIIRITGGTVVLRDIGVSCSTSSDTAIEAKTIHIHNSVIYAATVASKEILVRDSTLLATNPLILKISGYISDGYDVLVDNSILTGDEGVLGVVTTTGASSLGILNINKILISNSKLFSNKSITLSNDTTNNDRLVFDLISIENCNITGTSMLALWSTDTTLATFNTISIRNTKYVASDNADTTFFVGCTNFTRAVNRIILENLVLIYDAVTLTQPLSHDIKVAVSPTWVLDGEWGALTLVAEDVIANNIMMQNVAAGSRHADIFIYGCSYLNVNDVKITAVGYNSTYPIHRVWIFPKSDTSKHVVNGLHITMYNPTGTFQYATICIVKIIPGGDITISNSSVNNLGHNTPGYFITTGGPTPGSNNLNGLKLINNKISMTGLATGIRATLPTPKTVTGWDISDNNISAVTANSSGIVLNISDVLHATVCRNIMRSENQWDPIYIYFSGATTRSQIVLSANRASSITGESNIRVANADISNPTPRLSVYSNMCDEIILENIDINAPLGYRDPYLAGLETNYSFDTHAFLYNDGKCLVHNNAILGIEP